MTRLCPPRPLLTRSRSCSIDSVTHSSGTPPGGGDTNRGRDTCARVSPAITHPHFDTTLCSIDLSVLAAITGIFLDTLRHRHISVIAVEMTDRYWYRIEVWVCIEEQAGAVSRYRSRVICVSLVGMNRLPDAVGSIDRFSHFLRRVSIPSLSPWEEYRPSVSLAKTVTHSDVINSCGVQG